jgi:predicted nucleic acid-binding protein
MPKRTYIDTCLLIAAFKGEGELGRRALSVLDDPDRMLVVSDAVRLEAMPMARYHKQQEEVEFYEEVFGQAENIAWDNTALQQALAIAESHGVAAMDAIHVAHAAVAGVAEFITAERPTKPMFRVKAIALRSIRDS